MDKPSTSGLPQKPSIGRRVRLIPANPKPEGTTLPTSQPRVLPNVGTSQPPETSAGNLYSEIIETMDKLNRGGINEGETNSSESSSEAATLSGTQTSPTSLSSLKFTTDDENEAEEGQRKKRTGRTFEEIASKVIREMRKIEENEKRKSKETQRSGEPLEIPTGVVSREPQENPIREIYDLTETDNEETPALDDWRG